jgi:hypothetical protein
MLRVRSLAGTARMLALIALTLLVAACGQKYPLGDLRTRELARA